MPKQSLGFVSLAPRGEWDASVTYKRLDTVNYGGSSYIVLKALTGVTPVGDNVNYMLLASKGDNAFQVWLLQPGNEGKTYEDYEAWLKQPATEAGQRADEAATRAQGAADNANNAAATAQNAAQNANTAAEEARTNAATAKSEADAAREATSNANNAATEAKGAAKEAREAAQNANEAAGAIDGKIGGIQDELDKKANKTDIPTSLPANGGNADTVGGYTPDSLGRLLYPLTDIDDNIGFISGGYASQTAGTKPSNYGTILQVSNIHASPETGGAWVFQLVHAHGSPNPYWRSQYNNLGWTPWKVLAFISDIPTSLPASDVYAWAKAATKPTYNMSEITNAAQAAVTAGQVMRKVVVCNVKPEGFISRAAIGLTNPAGRYSPVVISAGMNDQGTLWYDWIFDPATGRILNPEGKQFAFLEDISEGGENYYPTEMNWTNGSVQGPKLNLSGVGMPTLSAVIPIAGVSVSGVVTTTDQVFAGKKSFNRGIDVISGGATVDGGIVVTNGTISCEGEVSSNNGFYETSDVRLKKNVTRIHLSKRRIMLYEFDKSGRHSYGVIAQEVEKLYPSTVKENEEGHKIVNYIEVLTIKCAEQDERIEALEKENADLKARLERIEQLLLSK